MHLDHQAEEYIIYKQYLGLQVFLRCWFFNMEDVMIALLLLL
jgi:hypothetical protein